VCGGERGTERRREGLSEEEGGDDASTIGEEPRWWGWCDQPRKEKREERGKERTLGTSTLRHG